MSKNVKKPAVDAGKTAVETGSQWEQGAPRVSVANTDPPERKIPRLALVRPDPLSPGYAAKSKLLLPSPKNPHFASLYRTGGVRCMTDSAPDKKSLSLDTSDAPAQLEVEPGSIGKLKTTSAETKPRRGKLSKQTAMTSADQPRANPETKDRELARVDIDNTVADSQGDKLKVTVVLSDPPVDLNAIDQDIPSAAASFSTTGQELSVKHEDKIDAMPELVPPAEITVPAEDLKVDGQHRHSEQQQPPQQQLARQQQQQEQPPSQQLQEYNLASSESEGPNTESESPSSKRVRLASTSSMSTDSYPGLEEGSMKPQKILLTEPEIYLMNKELLKSHNLDIEKYDRIAARRKFVQVNPESMEVTFEVPRPEDFESPIASPPADRKPEGYGHSAAAILVESEAQDRLAVLIQKACRCDIHVAEHDTTKIREPFGWDEFSPEHWRGAWFSYKEQYMGFYQSDVVAIDSNEDVEEKKDQALVACFKDFEREYHGHFTKRRTEIPFSTSETENAEDVEDSKSRLIRFLRGEDDDQNGSANVKIKEAVKPTSHSKMEATTTRKLMLTKLHEAEIIAEAERATEDDQDNAELLGVECKRLGFLTPDVAPRRAKKMDKKQPQDPQKVKDAKKSNVVKMKPNGNLNIGGL